MLIQIIAVGLLKASPFRDIIEDYLKRFHWRIKIHEIPAQKYTQLDSEAEKILSFHPQQGLLVIMDERGISLPSVEFAHSIDRWRQNYKTMSFIIGGDSGLSTHLQAQAGYKLALGPATWPHQLARLMLVEQLYRAQQILAGHPYHRI